MTTWRWKYARWGRSAAAGAAMIALIGACSSSSRVSRTSQMQGNPMRPRPTLTTQAATQPQPTAAMAAESHARPEALVVQGPIASEPIARALVEQMLSLIQDRRTGDDGLTHIGVTKLRNQSRATAEEFDGFCERLAKVLTQASPNPDVRFESGGAPGGVAFQYELSGAAYLVTFEGFDLWELYLNLSPAGKAVTIWSSSGATHVMRQPRAGEPQVVQIKLPR
jgi:hypothetical protein